MDAVVNFVVMDTLGSLRVCVDLSTRKVQAQIIDGPCSSCSH